MDRLHDAVAWYQKKIGTYDKQLWEQSVEQKVLKGIQHAPRKSGRVKTELIDVDLVRGSTFSKAKPQVPWTAITQRAVLRVLFFPLYYKWWVQQTSRKFWCFLLFLYLLQVSTAIVYIMNMGEYITEENVTLTEVVVPFVLMVILALVHSQTVLTHWSHKPLVRDNKSKRDGLDLEPGRAVHVVRGYVTRTTSLAQRENLPNQSNKKSPGKQQQSQQQTGASSARSSRHGSAEQGKQSRLNSNVGRTPGSEKEQSSSKEEDFQPPTTSDMIVNCNGSVTKEMKTCVVVKKCKGVLCDNHSNVAKGVTRAIGMSSQQADVSQDGRLKDSAEIFVNCENSGNSIKVKHSNAKNCDKKCPVNFSRHEWKRQGKITLAGCQGNGPCSGITLDDCDKQCKANGTSGEDSSGSLGKFEILSVNRQDLSCNTTPGKCRSCGERNFYQDTLRVDGSACDSTFALIEDSLDASFSKDEEETTSNDDELDSTLVDREVRRKRFKKSESRGKDCKSHHNSLCRSRSLLEEVTNTCSRGCETEERADLERSTQREANQSTSLRENRSETEDDVGDSDFFKIRRTYSSGHNGVRRRKSGGTCDVAAHESASFGTRTRRVPTSLGVRMQDLKESTGLSSSDGETSPASPLFSKGALSSEEWEFRIQSDVATSTSSASSCASDREMSEGELNTVSVSSHSHNAPQPDKVSCVIWEGNECKKVDLTALDIGWAIIEKVDSIAESSDYILIGLAFSVLMGLVPLAFRAYLSKTNLDITSLHGLVTIVYSIMDNPWRLNLIAFNGILQRFCLSMIFFFLLSVADRTFKQRLLYAKHFCYLTSSRRAKKYDMPHFRLNKVRNIKMWLSLRSYLKKRGPQRSVDVIVSSAFMLSIIHLAMMCIQLLKDTDKFLDSLCNWELCAWCLALGVYLLRFMTLGLKINKKYRNLSVLITEQINLYLQMEQKPHKKEELMLANNVLKLAEDLLKELESPFKISGMSANPFVYNATKVVLLSAFSAVLTELLGFKLKLYKIKIP
ncbi:LOW QUALITY PROTEIN: protein PHTF2-like [Liolophura sinensis]|uniref:LOW QUALITY PROTEIN: protein PHTF2-like n=1 Tax=Liolophura sinensis TaxID=3198878 RepID=UPI003158C850